MYIDDIKIFAKNVRELETITQTIRLESQHNGMQFWIENVLYL